MPQIPSLTTSLYEPYRTRLDQLADDSVLTRIIGNMGERRGWWAANRNWKRTFGRFFPKKSPWAVLIFASPAMGRDTEELCHIEFFEEIPDGLKADSLYEESVGWLHFKRFPNDVKLPTITSVLDKPGRAKVIRYRPGVRCTIRFDYDDGQPTVFAKVFPSKEDGQMVYDDAKMLWQATNKVGIGALIAQPLNWDAGTNSLWLSQVPGQPAIHRLRSENGTALAEKMGRVVASLARSELNPKVIFGREEQMKITMDAALKFTNVIPALSRPVGHLLETLTKIHNKVAMRPLVAIHGAPHPT